MPRPMRVKDGKFSWLVSPNTTLKALARQAYNEGKTLTFELRPLTYTVIPYRELRRGEKHAPFKTKVNAEAVLAAARLSQTDVIGGLAWVTRRDRTAKFAIVGR